MKGIIFQYCAVVAFLLLAVASAHAQVDSTAYVGKSSKKGPSHLGLFAGTGYSMLQLDNRAFFSPNNATIGSVKAVNSPMVCGGIFLTNVHWRIGIEALFKSSALVYNIGEPLTVHRTIQPMSFALPVSYSFFLKHNGDLTNHSKLKLIAGLRPSTSIGFLDTSYPELHRFSIAADFGFGYQFDFKMSKCNIELVYSRGLNNMTNAQSDNYQNLAVKRLTHDMIGIRAYFN